MSQEIDIGLLTLPPAPEGERALLAHPFDMWVKSRVGVERLDLLRLAELAAAQDDMTDGHGMYWLGRAIVAAWETDPAFPRVSKALSLVKAILARWQRESSYGSDAPARPGRRSQNAPASPDESPPAKWCGVWEQVIEQLRGDGDVETWLRPAALLDVTDDRAVIGSGNVFLRDELEEHWYARLRSALLAVLGRNVEVEIVIE